MYSKIKKNSNFYIYSFKPSKKIKKVLIQHLNNFLYSSRKILFENAIKIKLNPWYENDIQLKNTIKNNPKSLIINLVKKKLAHAKGSVIRINRKVSNNTVLFIRSLFLDFFSFLVLEIDN